MKITKRQLKKIIREAQRPDTTIPGIFDSDFLYDLLAEEIENYLQNKPAAGPGMNRLSGNDVANFKNAVGIAIDNIIGDYER